MILFIFTFALFICSNEAIFDVDIIHKNCPEMSKFNSSSALPTCAQGFKKIVRLLFAYTYTHTVFLEIGKISLYTIYLVSCSLTAFKNCGT